MGDLCISYERDTRKIVPTVMKKGKSKEKKKAKQSSLSTRIGYTLKTNRAGG